MLAAALSRVSSAARRASTSPFGARRIPVVRPTAPTTKIRTLSNAAPDGTSKSDKSLQDAMEFVKSLKEVFTSGTAHEQLKATETLAIKVERMDERMSNYKQLFWGSAILLLPSALAINCFLYFQHFQVNEMRENQKKLDENLQALDKRIHVLEYDKSKKEKLEKMEKKQLEKMEKKQPMQKSNGLTPTTPAA